MPLVPRLAVVTLALACSARVATAKDIVIETPGERTSANKLLLAGLTVTGGIAAALGVYWHLDGRSASDDVSADSFTGEPWSDDKQALVDRADRSRTRATIAYGVGGALLVTAVIALIATEPESTTTVIHTTPVPTVSPIEGGAMLGGAWSF
jgi:hypothetical protein